MAALLACAVSVASGAAHAQDDAPLEATPSAAPRALPDYDGRGPAPEHPAEPWLWVPRIATGPLYLVSEYLLRRPIGWLLTELEVAEIIPTVAEYLNGDYAVVPTALIDFGLVPSIGLFAFWDHFLFEENRIAANAATGGPDLLNAHVRDTVTVDDVQLLLRFQALRRADQIFAGVGPGPRNVRATRARYTEERIEAGARLDWSYWGRSRLRVEAGYRASGFEPATFADDPSIVEREQRFGDGSLPAGFETGYQAFRSRVELILDTREEGTRPGGGVRVAGFAQHGVSVRDPSRYHWLAYGGFVRLSTDALEHDRVLGVEADFALVEDLTDGDRGVPFTELIDPGGTGPLPAYLQGQLRGHSFASVTVRYEWPIWFALNGGIFASVGSVFDERFAGFDVGQLRYSFGVGLEAVDPGDHPFVFQVAFGSETFANGAELSNVRLLIGARDLL